MSQDESVLIEQARAGNQEAFAALVQQHGAMVYNLALRSLNNTQEAEDIAQESFVRAWKALPSFRADAQFSTWLYRIATNLCYNRLPRLKSEFDLLDSEAEGDIWDQRQAVEGSFLSREMRQALFRAVDELPESYRLLITLRHIQGLSYQEIADVTGMPLGTVKTGIFRARRRLRETLTYFEETPNG